MPNGLLRRLAHLSQALPGCWSCLLAKVASMLRCSKDEPCSSDMHGGHGTGGWVQSEGAKMRHAHAMRLPGARYSSMCGRVVQAMGPRQVAIQWGSPWSEA